MGPWRDDLRQERGVSSREVGATIKWDQIRCTRGAGDNYSAPYVLRTAAFAGEVSASLPPGNDIWLGISL